MAAAKRWFTYLLLATVIAVTLLPAHPASAERGFSNLNVFLNNLTTIDPTWLEYTDEAQVVNELFAGLVKIDPVSGGAVADLAQSWSWSGDAQEITLTLPDNLKWSDGQPLTADDARFGLLRSIASNTALNAPLLSILNAQAYHDGALTDLEQVGVYADSPTQLRIQLERPVAFFEKILALPVAFPQPQHLFPQHEADWTEQGVGSGPYRLSAWVKGVSMLLEANPHYHGPAPLIQSVNIRFDLDENTRWNNYYHGALDTISVPYTKLATLRDVQYYQDDVVSLEDPCINALLFNTDVAPLDNANVRKALIAAIDRQDLVDTVMLGYGKPVQTYVPPRVAGSIDGAAAGVGIPSSAAAAKDYLSAAGYPEGVDFPVLTIQTLDIPSYRARWDYFKARWQSVLNVTVNITYLENPTWPQPIKLIGWCADYNEGYNFLHDSVYFFKDISALGSWSNTEYDDLMDLIAQTTNANLRRVLYQTAEEYLTETDAVVAPLYVSVTNYLTQDYLDRGSLYSGFTYMPWHLWKMVNADNDAYAPGSPQTFAPEVGHTEYSLPADLFSQETTLTHAMVRPEDAPSAQPGELAGVGEVFSFSATTAAPSGLTGLATASGQTDQPYTIELLYAPEDLALQQIQSETSLALYAKIDGAWVRQTSTVDPLNHMVIATTWQINTEFMVFGTRGYQVFMPQVVAPTR